MDQILFHAGPLTVTWYGALMALGFIAALWTASRRAVLVGISPEKVADVGPWLIIGTIIGARLVYVISYPQSFAGKPLWHVFAVWQGGLVFYGGLFGASAACILFCRLNKIPLWRFADVLAPSVALGHAIGRLGCLMNGCCYGKVCELPWAIKFPASHETYPNAVHPTQIYESLLNFTLYLSLAWVFRKWRKFEGQVFAIYLMGYAIVRSTVEIFRGDYPKEYYLGGWMTPAHKVSIVILLAGIALYAWQRVNVAAKVETTPKTGSK
ncbi:MAG: lgt [Verrucomicrobia bacterium]|nr:lgt [Verrucomicrobiota bacterium]